jgi:hypothetical protein
MAPKKLPKIAKPPKNPVKLGDAAPIRWGK